MNQQRFGVLFQALCATFNVEPSEAMAEGYWLGCSDLEQTDFQRGVSRAIRECTFMPKPAELRRLSGEQTEDERAVLAWSTVKDAIQAHGAYRSIEFTDPAINAALRAMGGWPRLCGLEGDAFHTWAEKEFRRQYSAWTNMEPGEQGRSLPGVQELQNAIGTPVEMIRVPMLGQGKPKREIAVPGLRALPAPKSVDAIAAQIAAAKAVK